MAGMGTKTVPKLSPSEIVSAIDAKGGLIGLSAAAEICGKFPTNFKRDLSARLTQVSIEGVASTVYFRCEVEALAKELAAARSNGRR